MSLVFFVFFSSASLNFSASSLIALISSSVSVLLLIVICCSLLVPRSLAVTVTIPLASISKQTSIWGTPAFAIGIPSNLNRPIDLLPEAILRSPCNTFTSTIGWLSIDVVNTCFFWHGIVVFASTIGAIISPLVSIPNVKAQTSNNKRSPVTSPEIIFACLHAPNATASSGLTD